MDNNSLDILFLTQEEMVVCGVTDMDKCVKTMEDVFRLHGEGDTLMGEPMKHGSMMRWPEHRISQSMPKAGPDKRLCAMPAYVGGEFNIAGMKWYGSNTTNPQKLHLPRSMHLIVLNEPETGKPLAVMDGTLVSAMRTGAMGGLGAKYLASKNSEVAGIIGAGAISRAELMAFTVALEELKQVKVFDLFKGTSKKFTEEMKGKLGIEITSVDSVEEAVRDSDVIGVATAGETKPSIDTKWLKEGSYLAPLGGIRESEEMYLETKMVVDDIESLLSFTSRKESLGIFKDLSSLLSKGQVKENDFIELGEIVNNRTVGRENAEEKIMLLSFGLPIEDIAWAYTVYKQALNKGMGQKLQLWKEPYSL